MLGFKDWLRQVESSAYTRARRQYALGLGPPVPMNSRSTAPPGYVEEIEKRKKKKKKKKKHKISEESLPNPSIDKWLRSVDNLKRDLDSLEDKKYNSDLEDEDEEDDENNSELDSDDDSDLEDDFSDEDEDGEEEEDEDEDDFASEFMSIPTPQTSIDAGKEKIKSDNLKLFR